MTNDRGRRIFTREGLSKFLAKNKNKNKKTKTDTRSWSSCNSDKPVSKRIRSTPQMRHQIMVSDQILMVHAMYKVTQSPPHKIILILFKIFNNRFADTRTNPAKMMPCPSDLCFINKIFFLLFDLTYLD